MSYGEQASVAQENEKSFGDMIKKYTVCIAAEVVSGWVRQIIISCNPNLSAFCNILGTYGMYCSSWNSC